MRGRRVWLNDDIALALAPRAGVVLPVRVLHFTHHFAFVPYRVSPRLLADDAYDDGNVWLG